MGKQPLPGQLLLRRRRERAEKEGPPPFVIARNSQLADIVKNETKPWKS
jgi:hypothetical protein